MVVQVSDGLAAVTRSFIIAVQIPEPVFRPDANGLVVMEAEYYDAPDDRTYRLSVHTRRVQ